MDAAGFQLTRANALSVDGWHALFESCRGKADGIEPGLAAELAADLADLARDWPHDLPTGVIHADLFPDNVFFAGDRVTGIIDFYFACNDLLAYDVAICLNAWCFETDGAFNLTKAQALLQGYRRRRAAVAGRARGAADPGPRLGPALPDDPPLRLAAPGGRGDGQAQGPAGVSEEAPLPPRCRRPVGLRARMSASPRPTSRS